METQVLVIGAGPGGYVAAIKLGQLGKKALLVDRDALGGECLNYGCIPSKALIAAASVVHKARKAAEIGVSGQLSVDMAKIQDWRAKLIGGFSRGIAQLSKGNGVDILMGAARFTGPRSAEVTKADGTVEPVSFDSAIIATGSRPISLPGFAFDGKRVLGNKEVLELREVPPRLFVVGAGVIGLEIGMYLAKLGSKVTVVEMTAQILPGLEADLLAPVTRSLAKLGIEVLLGSKASAWSESGSGAAVSVSTPSGERVVEADRILVSVGRAPTTGGLGLEAAGVALSPRGFVQVDESYRTSVPHIYGIGDCTGSPFLAHKASREGILAAKAAAGLHADPIGAIPSAIFTDPEIATVGLTEAAARERGVETVTGRFPFMALGRAQASREADGFVKVVADKASGRILGAAFVGAGVSDLVSEACLAIKLGATLEDVASTIHPHPTLPEAFMEACEAALGSAIHVIARK